LRRTHLISAYGTLSAISSDHQTPPEVSLVDYRLSPRLFQDYAGKTGKGKPATKFRFFYSPESRRLRVDYHQVKPGRTLRRSTMTLISVVFSEK
jgi:hypothetical protein